MSNIKITIEGVEKELELVSYEGGDFFVNGKWYREVTQQPTYEILSFKSVTGVWYLNEDEIWYSRKSISIRYVLPEMLDYVKLGKATIHSVKRLSDGEVFTVGEDEENIGEILRITINNKGKVALCNNKNMVSLNLSVKVKQPTILLTTEDGVDITNAEQVLYLCYINFGRAINKFSTISANKSNKYFSTAKAMDEYILYNKPITVTWKELNESQIDYIELFKSKQK